MQARTRTQSIKRLRLTISAGNLVKLLGRLAHSTPLAHVELAVRVDHHGRSMPRYRLGHARVLIDVRLCLVPALYPEPRIFTVDAEELLHAAIAFAQNAEVRGAHRVEEQHLAGVARDPARCQESRGSRRRRNVRARRARAERGPGPIACGRRGRWVLRGRGRRRPSAPRGARRLRLSSPRPCPARPRRHPRPRPPPP